MTVATTEPTALRRSLSLPKFFDNLKSFAEVPEGVAKLRELILDLAVRGKLVKQDENDEPASELLERVEAERTRLIKDGKLRKRKISSSPTADEIPYLLPNGWEWTRPSIIGEVGPRNDVDDATEVSFLPMATISAGYAGTIEPEVRQWGEIRKGFTHVADGDIAMAKITPCFQNRKSAVIRGLKNGVGAGTTELHVLRPIDGAIVPEYALLQLKSLTYLEVGVSKMTGSAGQKRVPNAYFAETPFPLPPLAEQRRIVSKVDSLMSLCDELESNNVERVRLRERASRSCLKRLVSSRSPKSKDIDDLASAWQRLSDHFEVLYDTPKTLAHLRQYILQLAVQGKLVPQDPNDEPVEKSIADARKSAGHFPLESNGSPVNEGELDLPASWRWVSVHDVADHRLGKMLDKARNTGRPQPYLRNTNVHWFHFNLSSINEMPFEDHELDEFEVRRGDLMICEGGHGIARTAVWEEELDRVMFQKALHRVRPLGCLNSYFLAFCLRVYEATGVLQRYYTGAGIPHFTGKSLDKVLFPLPPLAEQKRIVAKVDQLLSQCDELSARLRDRRSATQQLLTATIHELLDLSSKPQQGTP